MARTFNTGGKASGREDLHWFDPRGIILDINENTRWHPPGEQPLNHAKVVRYAKQFIDPTKGQINPITVRIAEQKRPKCIAGFHRLAAALLVVNGSPKDGIKAHPDFRIRATVKDVNEAEAVEIGIAENREREGTTAIDDAENLRKLRNLGREDDYIRTQVLACSKKWIGTLEKLLKLPDPIKLAIHRKVISVENGEQMADMSPADREEILREALQSMQAPLEREMSGEANPEVAATLERMALTTTAARAEDAAAATTNGHASNGKAGKGEKGATRKLNTAIRKGINKKKEAQGKTVSRSRADLIEFCDFILNDDGASEPKKVFAKGMKEFMEGKRGDQGMHGVLNKVLVREL